MLFCLFWLFSFTISINANGYGSRICNLPEIDAFCNEANELYKPREVLWSGHSSSITLQVKDAELKHGKTGRVYHVVRTPTKLMDRQVKKRSTGARRLMKRGVAGADKKVRKGTLLAHRLARQGISLLDNQVVRGTTLAHNYLVQTTKSLDDKLVAGTKTTHHKVKHTLIPIDKGLVHGSSRAYRVAKRGVTAVDRRIKTSTKAVDQQLASGNMKGAPVTVPMKYFLSSVFKKGKKSKSAAALPTTADEPEPAPAAEISEMAESVSVASPQPEDEMKAISTESMKYSTESTDDNLTSDHEEKANERGTSMESLKDETISDLDMDDKHGDHDHLDDHSHHHLDDHLDDHSHNHLDDHGIDHLDEADQFDDHSHHDNKNEPHDPFAELDHDHEKGTDDHHDGHDHESIKFDGEPRSVGKKNKKKRYFQDKMRQVVPRASSTMISAYTKPRLLKNLSRSLTKISRPSSNSLSKMMARSKSLSRNVGKPLRSLPKNMSKPTQMLSRGVSTRSLNKLKGVKAFSKKKMPKSLAKFRMSQAPKPRVQ